MSSDSKQQGDFFQDVTEQDLQAVADGSVAPERRKALMDRILKHPSLLDRLEELMRQKTKIKNYFASLFSSELH